MTLLILAPNARPKIWAREIKLLDPNLDVRIWPNVDHLDDIALGTTETDIIVYDRPSKSSEVIFDDFFTLLISPNDFKAFVRPFLKPFS